MVQWLSMRSVLQYAARALAVSAALKDEVNFLSGTCHLFQARYTCMVSVYNNKTSGLLSVRNADGDLSTNDAIQSAVSGSMVRLHCYPIILCTLNILLPLRNTHINQQQLFLQSFIQTGNRQLISILCQLTQQFQVSLLYKRFYGFWNILCKLIISYISNLKFGMWNNAFVCVCVFQCCFFSFDLLLYFGFYPKLVDLISKIHSYIYIYIYIYLNLSK